MTAGFGAEASKDTEGKAIVEVDPDEMKNLMKEYKRLKKLQRSNLYQAAKLQGKETEIDRLLADYGDPNDKNNVQIGMLDYAQ